MPISLVQEENHAVAGFMTEDLIQSAPTAPFRHLFYTSCWLGGWLPREA